MKKNMLIRILSLICVLACLFAFASCHDDLATKEEVNQNKTDAETALKKAKDELNELIAAVRQTADAAAVKTDLDAAIERLEAVEGTANAAATLEALNAVKADLESVKTIAAAAATKTELEAAIAKIDELTELAATKAELEALKAEAATKAELENVKNSLDQLIADAATKAELEEVKADLAKAATKADLDATIAKLDKLVEDAATKEALEALKADAATKAELESTKEALEVLINNCATKEALAEAIAKIDALTEAAATKTELKAEVDAIKADLAKAATKAELDAAKVELQNAIDKNTSDIATINGKIETLATKTELADAKAELQNAINAVKDTADAAVTEKALSDAIAALELDKKIADTKTEVKGDITELETKLTALINENASAIEALQDEVKNIKIAVGDTTAIENLQKEIDDLADAIDKIDVDSFKKDFGALTDKLLDPDYEYAYSKFVEIVLDIDEGPYDPDEAKSVRLKAEDILFSVTRAVSEDGLKALYDELVSIKTNLKTLEESLTEKVNAITYINTSAECIEAVKAADKLYEKMIALEIEFQNPDLKAQYERIWNAFIELNGGLTKDETTNHTGLKNVAKDKIDNAFAALLNRDVKLGEDKGVIDGYKQAIKDLKNAIDNSAYRDLYEAGLAAGVIDAVKAEVVAEKTAEVKATLTATKRDEYKAPYEAAYIVEFIGYTLGEDEVTKTPVVDGAWYNEIINLIAADLKAADNTLSEDDAKANAIAAYTANAAAYATIADTAYTTVNVLASAKVNEDAVKAELYAKGDADIAKDAADAANDYVATDAGDKEVFVRAMAESLYNEDAAEAIAERYDNMAKAADDATALVGTVKTIILNWDNKGLLWNDTTAADAFNNIKAWVENAAYKSTNEAYITAYAFADDNVSDFNRDYVFDNYTNTITNYAQLTNVMGYVAALKGIYDNHNFVGVKGQGEEAEELYNVKGVEAFIVELKKAINGVDVDGTITLDVDNILIDLVDASIANLDEAIASAANNNAEAIAINKKAMIPDIARDRLAFIESVEQAAAKITDRIYKDKFAVITAAELIKGYENELEILYTSVLTKAEIINAEYSSEKVISSLAEAALDWAYDVFEEFTKYAGEQYLKAKALVEKLEALGVVKLNHGKDIYDVAIALQTIAAVIPGLTYDTEFPVTNEATGEHEMVNFSILQDKIINKYVPEYQALADQAVDKADELKLAIDDLLNTVGNNANKLDNFNAIVNMMTRVNTEWLVNFYSVDMHGAADNDKYVYATNVIAAIKAAVANTTDTKIIGGLGVTYEFLSNETFESLEAITNTAISTYKTVEGLAKQWIEDAEAIVNGGNYTFHDWDKEGKNFKNIEEAYAKIVKDYYIITALAADTDPDFGLYEAHKLFIVEYNKCKEADEKSAAEIKKIEDAINALGAYSTITLTNTDTVRTTVNEIFTLIANFEKDFCDMAQTDGDINADLLFKLAKYDAVLQVLEAWVAVEADWDPDWDVDAAYKTMIEGVDVTIDAQIASGNFATVDEAIESYIGLKSSEVKTIQ